MAATAELVKLRHHWVITFRRIGRGRLLNSGKLDFHYLAGFVSGRFPFPVANRVYRGLGEHGMSTFEVDGLHAAVGSDENFDFDNSSQRHAARKRRIGRGHALQQAPFARFLRVGKRGSKAKRGKKQGPNYGLPQQGFRPGIV